MTKPVLICFRAMPEARKRFKEAARRKGRSLTRFVLEAVELAAGKVEAMPATIKQLGGVPTFFRALCAEATQGGKSTYLGAGYELSRHLGRLIPDSIEDDEEWQQELNALGALLAPEAEAGMRWFTEEPDDDAVWEWFVSHFPRCMKLVPRRRRKQFLAGVYQAVEDEIISLEM